MTNIIVKHVLLSSRKHDLQVEKIGSRNWLKKVTEFYYVDVKSSSRVGRELQPLHHLKDAYNAELL
jgi:hypothetical protein